MLVRFTITGQPANVAQNMNLGINSDAKGKVFENKKDAEDWAERWIQRDIYMTHNRFQFDLKIEEI